MKVSIHGIVEGRLIAFTNRNKKIPYTDFENKVRKYVGEKYEKKVVNIARDCDVPHTIYVLYDFDNAPLTEVDI